MKVYFRSNNVAFGSITFSDKTTSAFKATGAFNDYKGMVTGKGFSMKAASATEWTDAAVSSATYAKTYSGLEAATEYDVRMYATVSGVKQYSEVFTVRTEVPAVTGITLDQDEVTLAPEEQEILVATLAPEHAEGDITWTTSAAAVATVADGVITAVAVGTATITATCGEYSDTCAVTVEADPLEGETEEE